MTGSKNKKMTHCRECNSEIAEAEAFCPFCGISLEHLNPNDQESDSQPGIEVGSELDSSDLTKDRPDGGSDFNLSATIVASSEELIGSKAPEEDDSDFVDVADLKGDTADEETVEPVEAAQARDGEAAAARAKETDAKQSDASALVNSDLAATAADDEEIDKAVAVIDTKADAWLESAESAESSESVDENGSEDLLSEIAEGAEIETASGSQIQETGEVDGEVVELNEEDVVFDSADEPALEESGDSGEAVLPSPPQIIKEELSAKSDDVDAVDQSLGAESKTPANEDEVSPIQDSSQVATGLDQVETSESVESSDGVENPNSRDIEDVSLESAVVETTQPETSDNSGIDTDAVEVEAPVIATSPDEFQDEDPLASGKDVDTGENQSPVLESKAPIEQEVPVPAAVSGFLEPVEREASEIDRKPEVSESPQTTPNMGVGDTDGSNTPKLQSA